MKPISLEITGINSFIEKQTIDFEKLTKVGLFGIFGDTGSGKSTILDCITLALYGKIHRTGQKTDFVNYRCFSGEVDFQFEISKKKYEVYRIFKLKKDRTSGLTEAFLYELDGGGKREIVSGATGVSGALEKIIGLNFDDFRKCIALPQGEFDKFTKSDRSERLDIIARLFSLEKYGLALYKKAREVSYKLAGEIKEEEARIEVLKDYTSERLEILKAEKEQKDFTLNEKALKLKETADALAEIDEMLRAKEQLLTAVNGLNELEEKKEEIVLLKGKIEKSEVAEKLHEKALEAEAIKKQADALSVRVSALNSEIEKLKNEVEYYTSADVVNDIQKQIFDIRILQNSLQSLEEEYNSAVETNKKISALKAQKNEFADRKKTIETDLNALDKTAKEIEEKLSDIPSEKELSSMAETAIREDERKKDFGKVASVLSEEKSLLSEMDDGSVLYGYVSNKLDDYSRRVEEVIGSFKETPLKEFEIDTGVKAEKNAAEIRKELTEKLTEAKINFEKRSAELSHIAERIKIIDDSIEDYALQLENSKKKIESVTQGKHFKPLREETDIRLTKTLEKQKKIERIVAENNVKLAEKNAEISETQLSFNILNNKYSEIIANLSSDMLKYGLTSDEIESCLLTKEEIERARSDIKTYEESIISLSYKKAEAEKKLGGKDVDLELGNRLIKEAEVFKEELSVLEKERAVLAEKIKEHEEKLTKKNSYEKAKRALVKKADVAKELETLTYGRKFLEFVSDEYLKEITVSASRTLLKLTHGKYALIYEEEFFVGDNDFGGARRSVRTLSGGEIFMVSLSLALSLSTAIYLKANKPIEFFFLDEGFGTLDEKKTDEVLSSLEKLKNSDFSIGLISHVKELKERITAKIIVNAATPDRGTTVSVEI